MSWWTSIVDGVKAAGNKATHALFAPGELATYAKKIGNGIMDQLGALPHSIPALYTDPKVWEITKGMSKVLFFRVGPILAVHYANQSMQLYFREADEQKENASYSAFVAFLSLIDYGVSAFTIRQGLVVVRDTFVLDLMGAAASNAHKALIQPPHSHCKELDCSMFRFFKGAGVESIILALHELLNALISRTPGIGPYVAPILTSYLVGLYITRMVTPERCNRHKAIEPSSAFALGIPYVVSSALMELTFKSTLGMSPALIHRTLLHFLLILHVNNAAHMAIPLAPLKTERLHYNPIDLLERGIMLATDIQIAGLKKIFPRNFQGEIKDQDPLISILQKMTWLFNLDQLQLNPPPPGLIISSLKEICPPTLYSIKVMTKDRTLAPFWQEIQKETLAIVKQVEEISQGIKMVQHVTTHKVDGAILSSLNQFLHLLGIKVKADHPIYAFLLKLNRRIECEQFIRTFRQWLDRNAPYLGPAVDLSALAPSVNPLFKGAIEEQALVSDKHSAPLSSLTQRTTTLPLSAILPRRRAPAISEIQPRNSSNSSITFFSNPTSKRTLATAPSTTSELRSNGSFN